MKVGETVTTHSHHRFTQQMNVRYFIPPKLLGRVGVVGQKLLGKVSTYKNLLLLTMSDRICSESGNPSRQVMVPALITRRGHRF